MSSSSSSSAAPIQYSQFGRQGIGVVQPQSGTDYPLVGIPSSDIRYLLADAWLSYDDPADYTPTLVEYCPPFRIAWAYGLGTLPSNTPGPYPTPVHDADILVVDCNNCVVFDSTEASTFYSQEWSDRLHIYGWETDDAVMFVVVHTKWAETADPNVTPKEYDVEFTPANAVLDERAIERRPKRVKSITVLLDNMSKKNINLAEGYNMNITHSGEFVRGLRVSQRITLDATPGNGIGIFPGCDAEDTTVRSINNTRPNAAGDFFMSALDCYSIRQPSSIINPAPRTFDFTGAMLNLGNDCSPCCDCDDYVAVANYMNRIRDKWKSLGIQLEGIRDQYHENRERFLDAKCCFEKFPLRLVVQPQRCPTLDVGAQFCNMSDQCVETLQMQICVELLNEASLGSECDIPVSYEIPGFTVIRGQTVKNPRRSSVAERYDMGGGHPCYTAAWDSVEASQSVWVRFRLGFTCCGLNSLDEPLFIRLTLSGTIGGEPITVLTCGSSASSADADVIDEITLRCPTDANDTFEICPGENPCA